MYESQTNASRVAAFVATRSFRVLRLMSTIWSAAAKDMANHGFAPSTNFTYEEPGVFRLRAMRDMHAGEEVV